jgi:hypothetical protein
VAQRYEYTRGDEPVTLQKCPPRDFCGSHDAMAIAKKWIQSEDDRAKLLDAMCEIVRRDHDITKGPMTAMIQAFFATPKQEAEAFLNVFRPL